MTAPSTLAGLPGLPVTRPRRIPKGCHARRRQHRGGYWHDNGLRLAGEAEARGEGGGEALAGARLAARCFGLAGNGRRGGRTHPERPL
eukprot:3946602-Prymnesium_polylepis.1